MQRVTCFRKNNIGFTLVELIIATALSLVILAGVFSFLVFGNRTFGMVNVQISNQFDVRTPMKFVTDEIRYVDSLMLLSTVPTPTTGYSDIYLEPGTNQMKYFKDGEQIAIPGITGVNNYKLTLTYNGNKLTYTIGKDGTTAYDETTQLVLVNTSSITAAVGIPIGIRFTKGAFVPEVPIASVSGAIHKLRWYILYMLSYGGSYVG